MREKIEKILKDFKSGKIEITEVLDKLKFLPFEDLGFAKIDTHRSLRKGFPETIFCQGKTISQILKILEVMSKHNHNILGTRADRKVYDAVRKVYEDVEYNETAKTFVIKKEKVKLKKGKILILTAGTSDIPVAEEAAVTAQIMGNKVDKLYDVGVAGVHRLLTHKEKILKANVIIVVAGMEGALASVVGGLTSKPVIAVPTSVGYGASFKGIAPLLTMLNSCSPGIVVVNIDNGFGAGYFASLINK
ncbi:nickel pincer cofactor biosynthesis protein LarB [Candidatus Aerophobetes bacterium]|uniref:Nickel pincer cofactor biosynthesis protein LarB n=1 Tax=Aerophobetes bacterium TaxID=2030807 RepID=A0A662D6I8_UNCAE|nr:MAG: nickel pincer cofactor biosynthesis protein LarB [Candidatus Aerophobetes bacterium]